MRTHFLLGMLALLFVAGGVASQAKDPAPARKPAAKSAATTAFTYQGRLILNNVATTGVYDFRFVLYDALTAGNVVSSATLDNVAVNSGLFVTPIDFGNIWDGGRYWMSINVRPGTSTGAYTALTPRQEITAAPHAMGLVFPLYTALASDSAAIDMDNAGVGGNLFMTGTPSFATAYFSSDAEGDAMRADANETAMGSAVTGMHYGTTGDAAYFEVANADNPGAGIFVRTAGPGQAIDAEINDTASEATALFARTDSTNANSYAGYFTGKVRVAGTLSKTAGSFQIDHPLDPANKYLNHSFVESPDMMNIYNGIAMLDAGGKAEVVLPDWFEALNKDFRYQLTAIGAPGPNLYIAQEVVKNRFKIAGGLAGQRVSWQVTGVRKDAYANAHRIVVEEDKPAAERGTYLHPELFGKARAKAADEVRHPRKP